MNRRGTLAALVTLLLLSSAAVYPQQKQPPAKSQKDDEKAKARQKELENKEMKRWLENDVSCIITDDERAAFNRLTTDEEREQFKETFWLRRDPTPDTIENEFRDEHYERIAYANERFSSGKPGWKTDRGRIYIIHGKPDDIEDHAAGGTYDRPFEEGGGTTSTYPFQKWTYRYIEGIGNNVELEFVDKSLSGEFRLTIDPYEKDALLNVPGAGCTMSEEENGCDKANRIAGIDGGDPTRLGTDANTRMRYNQFDRLDLFAKIFRPPEVKYKDLEAIVSTKLSFNLLPFDMRMDFVRVTEETVLTPITVSIPYKDLAFQEQEGLQKTQAHVFARITSVNGKIASQFEDQIGNILTPADYRRALETSAKYQKTVPLRPGLYKIDFVIKDIQSGNVGTIQKGFTVPRIPDEKLATSSLILADRIEALPPRQVSTGQFVLGSSKVVPNVKSEFDRTQNMSVWLQVYSLKVDETTHKPSATIETLITRNGNVVKRIAEDATEFSGAAQQLTYMKSIPLSEFEAGEYAVQVKITDNLSKETITSPGKTNFKVR
jgi:GWxTD domain-containing protein